MKGGERHKRIRTKPDEGMGCGVGGGENWGY